MPFNFAIVRNIIKEICNAEIIRTKLTLLFSVIKTVLRVYIYKILTINVCLANTVLYLSYFID
jgi:hypothetical protein